MRVTGTVWLGDFDGDSKSLAARAVAPCCAACSCGTVKEVLPVSVRYFETFRFGRAFSRYFSMSQLGI